MQLRFHAVIVTALLALPTSALAQGAGQYKKPLKDAAKALEDAGSKARRAGGRCRASMSDPLENAADKVFELRKGDMPRGFEVQQIRAEVSSYAASASFSGCPYPVLEDIQRALESLEEARIAIWAQRHGGGRDDDDDDDGRDGRGRQDGRQSAWAQMAALRVQTNATFEGERAVKVTVPELRMTNMQGRTFYLGARYRSYEGQWSDWVTTSAWTVPSEPFIWRNAFTHYLRFSTLAEDDFSDGRFVARVSVFDGNGAELAFREVTFRVTLPQLPPAPYPPGTMPPPPVQPPPVVQRDCGTGNDVGCTMTRDGQYPMDAGTWNGFLTSLRTNASEFQRQRICEATFQRSYVTAFQLGMVLDLFSSDNTRLIVARFAAPRVVNPQHALGFSSKWRSSAQATQYSQLMTAQLPGQPAQPPPVQPPPTMPPPPGAPPPPPGGFRDCGTGNDPGCGMSRNGQVPMDAATYDGFLVSLKANSNELVRADIVRTVMRSSALTALQLGAVLDLFQNELTRLDVAQTCAPRVVNPQHALGLAGKFQNTFNSQEYVRVMTSQMGR
ncbi:MAG: DUF4476 domain-containing protein [Myxococcota bacterium]|jgi:hypothetical protein